MPRTKREWSAGARWRAVAIGLAAACAGLAAAGPVAGGSAAPAGASPAAARGMAGCPAALDHRMPRLQDDVPQDLCQYAGKVVLVVNTASYCGFTRQYEGLEKLHARYGPHGFVVLGFPSNDFGNQEPGSSREIAEFCTNTFGVKFPMFAKSRVTGAQANPVFAGLAQAGGGAPRWNFHKYLLGRDGKLIASHPSETSPLDPRLVGQVERALQAPMTR